MPVYSTKGSKDIPEGAVRMTRKDALSHQQSVVQKWDKDSEVLFLKYGKYIASFTTIISSFIASTHSGKMLNIGNKGLYFTLVSGCLAPTASVFFTFDNRVTNSILLMENKCPMCAQFKSGLFQVFNNVLFPTFMGFVTATNMAVRYRTAYVPDLYDKKGVYQMFVTTLKPGVLKFQGLIAATIIMTFFIPYMQSKEIAEVTRRMEISELDESLKDISYEFN